jgi:hypothetical protein
MAIDRVLASPGSHYMDLGATGGLHTGFIKAAFLIEARSDLAVLLNSSQPMPSESIRTNRAVLESTGHVHRALAARFVAAS